MPEGHTIHRLAQDYAEAFAGTEVRVTSPQGKFSDAADLLTGGRLTRTDAHGKHLFLGFGPAGHPAPAESIPARPAAPGRAAPGPATAPAPAAQDPGGPDHDDPDHDDTAPSGWVHIHLGLFGKVAFGPVPAPPPADTVRLRLVNDIAHVDLRGPTTCALITAPEKRAVHDRLGPDPLREDADPGAAHRRISRSRTTVAALLMDQKVIAGVGNVYRAEVLFRHGIDPYRPGRDITPAEWDALWSDLVDLMREGVRANRIDTVRPEHTPEAMGRPPRVDDHGGEVYVYRRAHLPCLLCGTPVRTAGLAARNLFWCPTCQQR
ncbi:DNA-formamidopyrimidine glycosylase family protein [Streptomyces sp. NPDC052077]|uniref:Fpg/Nei family DNA glycosylase n=1 Tax=Streptomyces sp. NPDC052077 TaxID=3154757 RepID=UPI00341EF79D